MTIVKLDEKFCNMVDELCEIKGDEELQRGISWIDEQSRKRGISFYEMFFLVLQRHLVDEKAKEWVKSKQ